MFYGTEFVLFHSKSNRPMFFVILISFMILGFAVQARLKNRFKKYSQELLHNWMTGA